MKDHRESSSGADGDDVASRTAPGETALGSTVGLVTGLVGGGFALFALTTPVLKILGIIAWVSVAVVMLQAVRDRSKGLLSRPMLVVLSISGIAMLLFVIFLGSQPVERSAEADSVEAADGGRMDAASETADSPEVTTTTETTTETTTTSPSTTSTASSTPGSATMFLSDVQPVEDPSADSPWLVRSMQVKGVSYENSITPPDYVWCRWTQSDYVLGGAYSRFEAMVGIADDSPSTGPLTFYVLADDKRIKTITDVGIAAPKKVEVSVEGVSRLAIGIESPLGRDISDCPGPENVGVWLNPLLKPATP